MSVCATLDDGTILYAANIEIETAWERTSAGINDYIQDDILSNPHKIYRGSFYMDKEDYGPKKCVREGRKSPWGLQMY